jgi:periplasmic divalent cation tolerance protein
MKAARKKLIVLVTAPDLNTARIIARAVLESRAAACANLISGIESHYWWQGKIEKGKEILILLKTDGTRLGLLEKTILAHHPYETPEVVALPVTAASQRYLKWWQECLA